MNKYAIGLGVFIVLVLGAALAAPGMIDWDKHKPKIEQAIEDATGYDVAFGGPIKLAVLPFPHVVIEQLAVKIPAGSTGGEAVDLATLKKADVAVALLPLFTGEVSVNSVSLIEPVIKLQVARDGRQLWMTETLQKKGQAGAKSAPATPAERARGKKIALKKLEIENGTLIYSDSRTGKTQSLEKLNALVSADSLSGPFKVNGSTVWQGQTVDIEIQSGRIDDVAKTLALQASLVIPAADTSVTYSGVAGTNGGIDLQGETELKTANISAAMTALSGQASTLPPLPLSLQGLLTVKPDRADIKTLKVKLDSMEASGALAATNLKGENGPISVTANLESSGTVKLDGFMPVKSVKTVKAAEDKDSPKAPEAAQAFIPEIIKLPMPIDLNVNIKMAGAAYKDTTFGNIQIGIQKTGGQIVINESIGQMPGGGTLTSKSLMSFASSSQGGEKAGLIYSDPTITFDVKGDSKAPGKLLSAFLPASTIKSMQPLFKDAIALSAKGAVRPTQVLVDSGSFTLGKTALNLGASSYTLDKTGRDDVVLAVSGQDINIDYFMGEKTAPSAEDKVQTAEAVPSKPAAQALQESLKKLNLPVDMTLKADLSNVTMQSVTYSALHIDGTLKGNALNLTGASLTDPEGNVMQAAGTVKDISTLTGVDATLSGKTSDAIAFLSSFKMDTSKLPKDFGPLDLSVSLMGEKPDNLAFKANAKAMDGEGQANGVLVNALSDKPGVDKLSLSIKHPNFERMMQKFNPSYKAGVGMNKNVDVFANINQDADGYTLSGLRANIGSMSLTGDVSAKTGGAKPDIKANIVADNIPLDILSGKDKGQKGNAGGTTTVTGSQGSGGGKWSRNAINAAWMHKFNLDLKVNAKSIEYGNWLLQNAAVVSTLKDGTMTIGEAKADVYGGKMDLTATAKSASAEKGAPVTFNVKSAFNDVGLEPLAASFSGARPIKARGNVSLTLDAQSTGISPSALISALSGKGSINGKNIVMEGFDLAAISRSLVSTTKVADNVTGLAKAAKAGGETAFDTIDGPFTITEGVIAFPNLAMKGPSASVSNVGQISLPRWTIDMNTTIDLAEPPDAPNLAVRFQGPLDKPGNTFASNAMESYIQSRVTDKVQKVIGEKLGDKLGGQPELNNLLNGVLGGGQAKAPAPAPTPAPAQAEPQIAPSSGESAPAAETAPAPVPEKKQSTEKEMLNNVLQGIIGQ